MYKIPFNSLLMQYHSYNQRSLEQFEKNSNPKKNTLGFEAL